MSLKITIATRESRLALWQAEHVKALLEQPDTTIFVDPGLVGRVDRFGNLLIDLLKATSLLSLITISDLTFAGKTLVQGQGHVTEVYSLLLVIYFVMALALGRLMRTAERRVPGAAAKEGAR